MGKTRAQRGGRGRQLPLVRSVRTREAPTRTLREASERFDCGIDRRARGSPPPSVIVLAGRDMFTTVRGDIDGQARLVHLFTYNYRRPWPESLNFNGVLLAFTVASAALCALLAAPRCQHPRDRGAMRDLGALVRLGRQRLPLQDCAALGPARDGDGVLPAPRKPTRAARLVPDELEGRELLHRQSHAGVRGVGPEVQGLDRRAEAQGRDA